MKPNEAAVRAGHPARTAVEGAFRGVERRGILDK